MRVRMAQEGDCVTILRSAAATDCTTLERFTTNVNATVWVTQVDRTWVTVMYDHRQIRIRPEEVFANWGQDRTPKS